MENHINESSIIQNKSLQTKCDNFKNFSIVPDHLTVSPSDTRASKALKDKIEKVDI